MKKNSKMNSCNTRFIFCVLLAILMAGCASPLEFWVEPTNKKTIVADYLNVGDKIEMIIEGLSPEERFRFHKCGPKCNTATTISTYAQDDLDETGQAVFRAPENGDYYFWLENESGDGHSVKVNKELETKDGRQYIFESGTKVTISPIIRSNNQASLERMECYTFEKNRNATSYCDLDIRFNTTKPWNSIMCYGEVTFEYSGKIKDWKGFLRHIRATNKDLGPIDGMPVYVQVDFKESWSATNPELLWVKCETFTSNEDPGL